jgi:hypothetical protein
VTHIYTSVYTYICLHIISESPMENNWLCMRIHTYAYIYTRWLFGYTSGCSFAASLTVCIHHMCTYPDSRACIHTQNQTYTSTHPVCDTLPALLLDLIFLSIYTQTYTYIQSYTLVTHPVCDTLPALLLDLIF